MDLIADILLVAGSFGAAVYCYVLAARLRRSCGFAFLQRGDSHAAGEKVVHETGFLGVQLDQLV